MASCTRLALRSFSLLTCCLLLTQCDGDMTVVTGVPTPDLPVPTGISPAPVAGNPFQSLNISQTSADGRAAIGNLPAGMSADDVKVTVVDAPKVGGAESSLLSYTIGTPGVIPTEPIPFYLNTADIPGDTPPDQLVIAIITTEEVEQIVLNDDGTPVMVDATDEHGNVIMETITHADGTTTEQPKQEPKTETVVQEVVTTLPVEYDAETGVITTELPQLGTVVVLPPAAPVVGQCGPVTAEGVALAPTSIEAHIKLPQNFPNQFYDLYYSYFNSGSKMGRGHLCARFCSDAACAHPTAIVPVTVPGADSKGYLYSTNPSDKSFKSVTITQAPVGAQYVQFILDTQYGNEINGKQPSDSPQGGPWSMGVWSHGCNAFANCPADLDLLQTSAAPIAKNTNGLNSNNPAPITTPITVEDGKPVTLADPIYLGSIYMSRTEIAAKPATESGRLAVSVSNGAYKNKIQLLDLSTYALSSDSYVLQHKGADFIGDVCGFVRSATQLYAIGVDIATGAGAHIFALDHVTGQQLHQNTTFISNPDFVDADQNGVPDKAVSVNNLPYPCRGVAVAKGGKQWLYLLQFKGAGSEATSYPEPLYAVDVTNFSDTAPGIVTKPLHDLSISSMALRTAAVNAAKSHLFLGEMSWSYDNQSDAKKNKILMFSLDGAGKLSVPADKKNLKITVTEATADEKCGGQVNYPAGMAIVPYAGKELLLLGHDRGLTSYEVATTTQSTPGKAPTIEGWLHEITLRTPLHFSGGRPGDMKKAKALVLADFETHQSGKGLSKNEIAYLAEKITILDSAILDALKTKTVDFHQSAEIKKFSHAQYGALLKGRKAYLAQTPTSKSTSTVELTAPGNIDLQAFGQLFTDLQTAPDGTLLYAMPMCKTAPAFKTFTLPYGASTEFSDKNLIAMLDLQGSSTLPAVATTTIDVNSDGAPDHGVDLDYYHLKRYIRSFDSTLTIPPVVYTGPQMAIGAQSIFVRGAGIQGDGKKSISSSGMGQVQDIGVFDRTSGRGIVFQDYNPFINGLSSEAGKGNGKWGLELSAPDVEASTGGIIYLPETPLPD